MEPKAAKKQSKKGAKKGSKRKVQRESTASATPPPSADVVMTGMAQLLRRAERLDPEAHADLKITGGKDYAFASGLHSVPLSAVEFMPSARHYPIIFAGNKEIQPVALLGLRPGQNLFVEPSGAWREGCYVPAILRRAPFVLLQDYKSGQGGVGLCLDVESPLVSESEGTPLFKDGRPTQIVAKMATFAASYSKEQARTQYFVRACQEHDLFVERRMEITLADGQKIIFRGLKVIDEERMRSRPDSVALEFFRRGWSALAVAHFLSLGNMGRLHHAANRILTA